LPFYHLNCRIPVSYIEVLVLTRRAEAVPATSPTTCTRTRPWKRTFTICIIRWVTLLWLKCCQSDDAAFLTPLTNLIKAIIKPNRSD